MDSPAEEARRSPKRLLTAWPSVGCPGMMVSMEQSPQHVRRLVDVTGLSAEVIRAVESFVAALRSQTGSRGVGFTSAEEWSKAFREWARSHAKVDTLLDDTRESIYAGRGE